MLDMYQTLCQPKKKKKKKKSVTTPTAGWELDPMSASETTDTKSKKPAPIGDSPMPHLPSSLITSSSSAPAAPTSTIDETHAALLARHLAGLRKLRRFTDLKV